jgi:antitoxin component YwqK of YwqJK toxin-antitoxin module
MKNLLFFVLISSLLSCERNGFNDATKRNENWVWWVDSKTDLGHWIPFSTVTTVSDGNYTLFYFNGKIYKTGRLKNGKDIDTSYVYDINEKLIKYELFKTDTMIQYYINDGLYKAYFQTGKTSEEGVVKNHAIGNIWTVYFENEKIKWTEKLIGDERIHISYFENGSVQDSVSTTDGKQNGRVKFWYDNGQIHEISDWKNGVEDGLYETFYENGKIKDSAIWIGGNREGMSKTWYENGQIESERFNENSELNGKVTTWYSNGNIRSDCQYVNDQKNGNAIYYYENGKTKSIGNYQNDLICGKVKFFNTDGILIQIDSYKNGQMIGTRKF